MALDEQLDRLANDEGEAFIGPDTDNEQDLKSFQADVRRLQALAQEGVIEIVGEPHRESYTGKRYVDRVRVRLTVSGDELREALRR